MQTKRTKKGGKCFAKQIIKQIYPGQKYRNNHVCLDRARPCPDIDEIDVIVPYVVPSEPVLNALSGLPGFHKAGHELVIDNVPSWEECGEEYLFFFFLFL